MWVVEKVQRKMYPALIRHLEISPSSETQGTLNFLRFLKAHNIFLAPQLWGNISSAWVLWLHYVVVTLKTKGARALCSPGKKVRSSVCLIALLKGENILRLESWSSYTSAFCLKTKKQKTGNQRFEKFPRVLRWITLCSCPVIVLSSLKPHEGRAWSTCLLFYPRVMHSPRHMESTPETIFEQRINKKLVQAPLKLGSTSSDPTLFYPSAWVSLSHLPLNQTQLWEADNSLVRAPGTKSAPGNSECQKYVEKVL